MEKKIIESLDRLSIEQTERLLNKNIEMKISRRKQNRIKNSVFEKIEPMKKTKVYIKKRLVVCAVLFAMLFTSLSIVGLDNVTAAIRDLFAFVPGIGIVEKNEVPIYTINPIADRIKHENSKAEIISALYGNGLLTVTISVDGKSVHYDDFKLYINRDFIDYRKDQLAILSWSSTDVMLSFSVDIKAPTKQDVFEIVVRDFPKPLSFRLAPAKFYEDMEEIGPTDIQNGISITTRTQRIDNQLIVWCYPFNVTEKSKDFIAGFGTPANAAFNKTKFITTESGEIFDNRAGWHIRERMIFDISESDKTATLHIPYLSMLREEKSRLKIRLPGGNTTIKSDASIQTSLGTIKVTEVKREPYIYEAHKDTVWIKFEFENNDENRAIYSFEFESAGKYLSNARHYEPETGTLEYLEVQVDKDDDMVSLKISQLYYYLFGEYIIPLDIE